MDTLAGEWRDKGSNLRMDLLGHMGRHWTSLPVKYLQPLWIFRITTVVV